MALADAITGLLDSPLLKVALNEPGASGTAGKTMASELLGFFTPENMAAIAAALIMGIAAAIAGAPILAVLGAAILTGIAAWFLANMAYVWGDKAMEIARNIGVWFGASVAWWKIEFENWWKSAQNLFKPIGDLIWDLAEKIGNAFITVYNKIANLPGFNLFMQPIPTPSITPTGGGTKTAGADFSNKQINNSPTYNSSSTVNTYSGSDWTSILKLPTEQWGGGGGQMA
jgi:hypothetical protein